MARTAQVVRNTKETQITVNVNLDGSGDARLKTGMSRTQVRALLGTPLIADVFHPDRWDYLYRLERDGEFVTRQRLTLFFEGEELKRIDDSNMPAQP